jgi:hypothetical protein
MAQQVQVLLTDDLDGGEANETIQFTLDGTLYEIDLSTGNAAQLRKDIGPWVEHARKTTGGGSPQRRGRSARAHAASIRVWARAAGYQVSDRGRIPPRIVDEYDAAH